MAFVRRLATPAWRRNAFVRRLQLQAHGRNGHRGRGEAVWERFLGHRISGGLIVTSSRAASNGVVVARRKLSIEAADAATRASSASFRSEYCGDIREAAVGQRVRVSGWVHSFRHLGKHGIAFAVIRDWTGTVQATWIAADSASIGLDPSSAGGDDDGGSGDSDGRLSLETVVSVAGTVRRRPAEMVNASMRTGALEIEVDNIRVLNSATNVPVEVKATMASRQKGSSKGSNNSDGAAEDEGLGGSAGVFEQSEDFLLRNRHLQLRLPDLQRNLRVRSDVTSSVRSFMTARHFVEVCGASGAVGRGGERSGAVSLSKVVCVCVCVCVSVSARDHEIKRLMFTHTTRTQSWLPRLQGAAMTGARQCVRAINSVTPFEAQL